MAEAAINLTAGQKADRKLDMIFVNVGGSGTESWELLGRGVEDASVEYNHDTDTVTDILGITDVNVSAAKPELDLAGCTIVPQSLGGSDYVGMPMNVHLSNNKTLGTCTIAAGVPTFTEE